MSVRQIFYATLTLLVCFSALTLWNFMFKKDFNPNSRAVILANNFESKSSADNIKSNLRSKNINFTESDEKETEAIKFKTIKIKKYEVFGIEGELDLFFLNNELEKVSFKPTNKINFLDKFKSKYKIENNTQERFNIGDGSYVLINDEHFLWGDENMSKKHLWLMRRYGSD